MASAGYRRIKRIFPLLAYFYLTILFEGLGHLCIVLSFDIINLNAIKSKQATEDKVPND